MASVMLALSIIVIVAGGPNNSDPASPRSLHISLNLASLGLALYILMLTIAHLAITAPPI